MNTKFGFHMYWFHAETKKKFRNTQKIGNMCFFSSAGIPYSIIIFMGFPNFRSTCLNNVNHITWEKLALLFSKVFFMPQSWYQIGCTGMPATCLLF